MRTSGPAADRVRMATLVCLDALTYALAVTAVVTVASVVLGVATGGGLVRAKVLLFLIGFGLMGYATFRLWPSSPADVEDRGGGRGGLAGISTVETPDETRFQRFVRALPPLRWVPVPSPDARLAPATKLFLGSLFVLATSYLMETVFGVV